MLIEVGKVYKAPKEVSSTEFIKIFSDARQCPSKKRGSNWELLAYSYDPISGRCVGPYFQVTEEEMQKWMGV